MQLEDLVGEHVLLGVDYYNEQVERYGYNEDSQHCLFELETCSYVVVEDPDDGYRSAMQEIRPIKDKAKNSFPGERVLARMAGNESSYQVDNVLEFISIETGKVVLQVGTKNTDDYYPWFCAEFSPENLSANSCVPERQ